MVQEIQMPKLGQTMEEGTVEQWLLKEGDEVVKGEPLFEVTTDKATLEVEAFVEGTLLKILVPEGEMVAVNEILAYVGEKNEAAPEPPLRLPLPSKEEGARPAPAPAATATAVAAAPRPAPTKAKAAKPAARPMPAPAKPEEVKASPRARKLAKAEKVPLPILRGSGPGGRIIEEDVEKYLQETRDVKITPTARELALQSNVDLRLLQGSGPNGKLTKEDVEAAAAAVAAGPAAGRVELTAMRRIVADRMTESKTTVPHFYLTVEVDMTNVISLRKAINAENGAKVSYNDIILKACADAFAQVPRMNAEWGGDHIVVHAGADIALAVSIEDGLMVPVVRDIQAKGYLQISEETQDLIARARSKRLGPDEYQGGTLTLSNLGMMGIDNFIPIINPGQASILGVGRIQDKVVVIDGGMHVRPMTTMTLSGDHRIVNGAEGAEYIAAVKDILENVGE
ncbi:MAG: 2-oxo acid dehydrogenase subunit E2 [Planctomycetes bacterium]|nr:2-oxo acid dehydrogenase subunit E2 [Planctomycetota bacterium]